MKYNLVTKQPSINLNEAIEKEGLNNFVKIMRYNDFDSRLESEIIEFGKFMANSKFQYNKIGEIELNIRLNKGDIYKDYEVECIRVNKSDELDILLKLDNKSVIISDENIELIKTYNWKKRRSNK